MEEAAEYFLRQLQKVDHPAFHWQVMAFAEQTPAPDLQRWMTHAITLYNKNKLTWITSNKTPSVFNTTATAPTATVNATPVRPPARSQAAGRQGGAPRVPRQGRATGARATHDAAGNPIDRTPPAQGQAHSRQGLHPHWCKTCERWGNHLTKDHDEWAKRFFRNRRPYNGGGRGGGRGNGGGRGGGGRGNGGGRGRAGRGPSTADHGKGPLQMPRNNFAQHF
jgi:hypothetical protein